MSWRKHCEDCSFSTGWTWLD